MQRELKPCPKCGSDELSYGWSSPGFDGSMRTGNVECHNCDHLVIAPSEADAVKRWNRRADA